MKARSISHPSFRPIALVIFWSGAAMFASGVDTGAQSRIDAGSISDVGGRQAAALSPLVTSWFTQNSTRYARVVQETGTAPVIVWPSSGLPRQGGGQAKPAYADVQQVSYSADWVYVKGTGLASHPMGPWYVGVGRIFGNWPSNQSYIRRIPRNPQPTAKKVTNGLGDLGVWVNGVALFNMLDGGYYDSVVGREAMRPPFPGQKDTAIWVRNAVPVEGPTFDKSNAHQPPMGTYHYHSNPLGLRYQLGDNVAYDASTGNYREDAARPHHSPILGWSYDGYPIYGPYGYADPMNPTSGVRRMVSGFVLRDGAHNTTDLRRTGRRSLAKWAAEQHGTKTALGSDQVGPAVSSRYPLGRYCEDYDYLGDLGEAQGKDFDLDRYNGRYCITPEFPQGTYAYFVALNADGSAAYPYVIGRQYYGTPSGGNVAAIQEPVTLYRAAGTETPIEVAVKATPDGGKEISWKSIEGAHYRVEAGADGAQWDQLASDVRGTGERAVVEVKAGDPQAQAQRFRVTLASLDPYDNTAPTARRGPGGPGGPGMPGGPGGFGEPGGPDGPDGPGGPPPNGALSTLQPASAQRGMAVTVRMTLDAPRLPPDFVQPTSVTIGTLKARRVTWDGATVVAEFLLPSGSTPGTQDVKVVFPGPPGSGFDVTFTGKAAFNVTSH